MYLQADLPVCCRTVFENAVSELKPFLPALFFFSVSSLEGFTIWGEGVRKGNETAPLRQIVLLTEETKIAVLWWGWGGRWHWCSHKFESQLLLSNDSDHLCALCRVLLQSALGVSQKVKREKWQQLVYEVCAFGGTYMQWSIFLYL